MARALRALAFGDLGARRKQDPSSSLRMTECIREILLRLTGRAGTRVDISASIRAGTLSDSARSEKIGDSSLRSRMIRGQEARSRILNRARNQSRSGSLSPRAEFGPSPFGRLSGRLFDPLPNGAGGNQNRRSLWILLLRISVWLDASRHPVLGRTHGRRKAERGLYSGRTYRVTCIFGSRSTRGGSRDSRARLLNYSATDSAAATCTIRMARA
jgi:hypothetical protein